LERSTFLEFVERLGYAYVDETQNIAYRMFLRPLPKNES
jgi:hypothetical protein